MVVLQQQPDALALVSCIATLRSNGCIFFACASQLLLVHEAAYEARRDAEEAKPKGKGTKDKDDATE
jgi:hypothetical protein